MAPVTLLVGENSTGKTSLLALIRALSGLVHSSSVAEFKEDPYDLGSFDEIAYHGSRKSGRSDSFEAGFETSHLIGESESKKSQQFKFRATFKERGTIPYPIFRRFQRGSTWIELEFEPTATFGIRAGTKNGEWVKTLPQNGAAWYGGFDDVNIPPLVVLLTILRNPPGSDDPELSPVGDSPEFTSEDSQLINQLAFSVLQNDFLPFSSAPVRSKPRRTYDPDRPTRDPEGDYVPMYLANLNYQDPARWAEFKSQLESFGRDSGLFDKISIRRLGKRSGDPFQVQIRKSRGRRGGPNRNLIDVGYGVSQVLPIITDLLRRDVPATFLLQQPEVHLHPSAQAALGGLFCKIAEAGRQLIVETHSDHLVDRVRMDVRDGRTKLRPEDVSILYFERVALHVRIHSLSIDMHGNIQNPPAGYRSFFMEETNRFLKL